MFPNLLGVSESLHKQWHPQENRSGYLKKSREIVACSRKSCKKDIIFRGISRSSRETGIILHGKSWNFSKNGIIFPKLARSSTENHEITNTSVKPARTLEKQLRVLAEIARSLARPYRSLACPIWPTNPITGINIGPNRLKA